MRVLLLCIAAFVVGLLAGALFWPRGDAAWERVRTPREGPTPPAPREHRLVARGGEVGALASEAEAALERNVPRDDDAVAEGTITGSVRGPAGEPIAGVIVSAFPDTVPAGVSQAHRGTRSRERRHEDMALSAVAHDAILRELWRRRSRCLATTGADGRYEMRVLATVGYRLYAFHERYAVGPVARDGAAGSVVDFSARPVVTVRVEVRMPDGTLAKSAWLYWRGPDGGGYAAWEPQKAQARLPGEPCFVRAHAWAPDPLQSDEVKHTPGGVLVLQLRGRRVLKARLVLPEGLAVPESVKYRLRCLTDSEEPDPASLRQDQTAREGHSSASVPGEAFWYDLAPGRYLVVAFVGGSRFAHAVVEVGDGPIDVDLQVPDPAAGPHIIVRLLGPDGGLVTGRAWFSLEPRSGPRPRYLRTETVRRKDGSWMLLLKDTNVPGAAMLGVGADGYGFVERPIDVVNAGSITVHFLAPARVRLGVEGYAKSGLAGRLSGGLVGQRAALRRQRLLIADGTCELAHVQPGEYGLQLILRDRDGKSWPIAQRRVVLEAGVNEHTMAVPVLQTLRVRPTGRLRGQTVKLHCTDPAVGSFTRKVRWSREGVAVFENLGPGSYEIECRDKRFQVRVPGPAEVTLE